MKTLGSEFKSFPPHENEGAMKSLRRQIKNVAHVVANIVPEAVKARRDVTAAGGPRREGVDLPNFRTFDRMLRSMLARVTQGVSPVAIADAWNEWASNLLTAPGKQLALTLRGSVDLARLLLWLPNAAAADRNKRHSFLNQTTSSSVTPVGRNGRSMSSSKFS